MKTSMLVFIGIICLTFTNSYGQYQEEGREEIHTVFKKNPVRSSGGYGAISNKFTSIGGQYANLVEMYGGWYVNHKFLLGLSGSATTNNIPVPAA
ncbi:MAG TPA: hypothetical protein VIS49_04455 [Cyclobacteriaceae bacterium]